MISRLFSFLTYAALGAAFGFVWGLVQWNVQSLTAVLVGTLLGAFCWAMWDAWRGYRMRSWLKHGDLAMSPSLSGWWGLALDRARRLLRERDRAIQASDQRLKDFLSAIQASPNGVVMLDANAQIEWCNDTASVQLGISPERDVMQRIGNLIRDPLFAAYMAAEHAAEPVVIAGREHRAERPVRISVQRHRYGEGKQLLLTRDVTLVEQAEAMRRDFVANVSHEIRTPLTVLSGFVETMQTLHLQAQEQQHFLALMATQAKRMQSLVEDLLTLSRLEGSPNPGYVQTVWLAELLKACVQEAQGLSTTVVQSEAPHLIQAIVPPELSHVQLLGEVRELQSALSNLLSNAVRYTPAGGEVRVCVALNEDGYLSLSVQDTGAGIAAEHVPRLTERFYRVDRSRSRDSGGTGLGLAIVKHVMQRHGGHLHISSVVGQGSTFTLTLPPTRWTAH